MEVRTLTNEQLIAAARKAYEEGTLTAQRPPEEKGGSPSYRQTGHSGKVYKCGIGAALTDEEIDLIAIRGDNYARVHSLSEAIVKFADLTFADRLQRAHDRWANQITVLYSRKERGMADEDDEREERIYHNQFREIIGLPALEVA